MTDLTDDSEAMKRNVMQEKLPKVNLKDVGNSESTTGVTLTILVNCFASSLDYTFPSMSVDLGMAEDFFWNILMILDP